MQWVSAQHHLFHFHHVFRNIKALRAVACTGTAADAACGALVLIQCEDTGKPPCSTDFCLIIGPHQKRNLKSHVRSYCCDISFCLASLEHLNFANNRKPPIKYNAAASIQAPTRWRFLSFLISFLYHFQNMKQSSPFWKPDLHGRDSGDCNDRISGNQKLSFPAFHNDCKPDGHRLWQDRNTY